MPDCCGQRCRAARGNSNLGAYHGPEKENWEIAMPRHAQTGHTGHKFALSALFSDHPRGFIHPGTQNGLRDQMREVKDCSPDSSSLNSVGGRHQPQKRHRTTANQKQFRQHQPIRNFKPATLPSVCAISRAPARSIRIGHRQLRIPPPCSDGFRSKSLATGSRFETNLAISKPRTTVDENRNRRAVAIPAQTGLHKRRCANQIKYQKGTQWLLWPADVTAVVRIE